MPRLVKFNFYSLFFASTMLFENILFCNLSNKIRHTFIMGRIHLFFVLISLSLSTVVSSQSYGAHTVGGWIEVKNLGNAKYQVDCQLLTSLAGATAVLPDHQKRVRVDTAVEFRIYDSAQNYVKISATLLDGCFYTQKDTANKLMESKQVIWNNHYKNTFRCTVDLNSVYIKSKININSSFLEFYCNYTGMILGTYSMVKTFGMQWNYENPISRTRVYPKELPINETSLVYSHVGFSKLLDYNVDTYRAVNYLNHGAYGKYGDSVVMELVKPEEITGKSNVYEKGYSASAPFYAYCLDSSNTCAPKPNATPPQGFYFNPATGDFVFTSMREKQLGRYAMKAHHYRKNASGQWRYLGYTELHHAMITWNNLLFLDKSDLTLFPTFAMPASIDLCEGDESTTSIKTQVTQLLNKYTASVDGNFPDASVTTDYSTGNSTPTFKIKVVARSGDYSPTPGIVTLRVHADSNWTRGEAARSVPVYVHKPIIPVIAVAANGCNNLKGILKSVNTDVPVKVIWTIHEKSPSAPAIFTSTAKELVYSGLLPEKYFIKCFVMPVAATCKCTGKTVIDSLDMKKLWPGLDFGLNRNTVCLKDSSKVYFASNVKNFKSKVYYSWEVNGQTLFGLKDTLSMNFTGATTLKLTLRDDSGCMSTKTFVLPVDTIYSLQQASSLSHCGPDTLILAATSTFSSNYWLGQYSVIDGSGNTIYSVRDSILSYYYKDARYYVLSEFTSKNGCYTSFKTDVFIDTTQLRFKAMPKQLCKGMKTLALSDIGATPASGLWSHSQGNGNSITLDKFSKYPSSFWLTYIYENAATKCLYIRSDSFWVTDTIKTNLGRIDGICKETKLWDAPKEFKSTSAGVWYSPTSGLAIDSTGRINPRNSSAGTFTVNKHSKNASGCDYQSEGQISIAPAVLSISGTLSASAGKVPLIVNFEGKNGIAGATQYKWIFGDTKQSPKDTAWGASVSYTYKDTGKYYPRLIGMAAGCRDTISLAVVNARLLSTNKMGEKLTVNLYPNPSGAGNEVVLRIDGNNKSRGITIYNAVGGNVSSHRIENGQAQITLTAAAPGIYFIEVEGSGNQIKWVVE